MAAHDEASVPTPAALGPRIRAKLAEAKRRKLACFGSEAHRFELGPCLREAEVAAFEVRHGISLPEAYREFVLRVGNGPGRYGAGPYYGIYGLDLKHNFVDLALPCPLTPETQFEDEGEAPWYETLGFADEDDCYHGALGIGTQGCNYDMLLVVTGPARGRVLYVALGEGPPYFVPDRDFLSWYERWLDELLAGYRMDYFGQGLIGSEPELVAQLLRDDATEDDRRAAAGALNRMPALSPQTIDLLLESLHDPRPEFRSLAINVLANKRYAPAAGEIRKLLFDDDRRVRDAAITAASRVLGDEWPEVLRSFMRDEPSWTGSVLLELGVGKRLTWNDLEPLLDSPDVKVRRSAMNALCHVHPHVDGRAMARLLDDEDAEVRSEAISGVHLYAPQSESPRLLAARIDREPDPEVRRSLAASLGYLPGREARAALERLAQDRDAQVREAATNALANHRERHGTWWSRLFGG